MEQNVLFLLIIIGLSSYIKAQMNNGITIHEDDHDAMEQLYQDTFNSSSPGSFRSSFVEEADIEILETDVKYHLLTPSNPNNSYLMKINDVDNLKASLFNSTLQTKVIIHGWMANVSDSWIKTFCKNYFEINDYNIILIDWYPLSSAIYPTAVRYTYSVGEYTGKFLKYLNANANLSYENLHMLGHSLGAHIAGFTGAILSGASYRITGMDPAGPLFEVPLKRPPNRRLDSTDAKFVDIIHTCSGIVGFSAAIGHADFYPNYGTLNQPGCSAFQTLTCSHSRSHDLMMDSIIYPNEFLALRCENRHLYIKGQCQGNDIEIMGENINLNIRGIYYLLTNSKSPYGRNKKAE